MIKSSVSQIKDLRGYNSAPQLEQYERKKLLIELESYIKTSDWYTVGIMASSIQKAVSSLREVESYFKWEGMQIVEKPREEDGPVFLKANQSTGNIYIRIEYGLGEGIILSCQHNDMNLSAETLGPFPLDFFNT